METPSTSVVSGDMTQVDRLRVWRHDAYMQHHYNTSEHIGDKILALTNDPNDAFWLAQVHYASGNYTRAKQLLTRQELSKSVSCTYLAGLCLVKMDKHEEALDLIGETNNFESPKTPEGSIKLEASMNYLRGQIYTAQSNFDRAKDCFQQAVKDDPKCFEAFDQLVKNNLMTPQEEWHLLRSLQFDKHCGENAELTKALYTIRLGKYTNLQGYLEAEAVLKDDYGLGENVDVIQSRADMLFIQCRFKDCLELCEKVLKKDQYKFSALPNYLACLHELGSRNKLYLLSHDLVDNHANEPVSWLAVGIYYLTIGKIAEARRYFSKASIMNPYFGQAWIGFAHTFAVEGEHEQAISAYSTAARLFPGTHLPSLFLGMQHLHLSNLTLAEEYLSASHSICKTDPLLLNEMGVVFYHKSELKVAESYFHEALKAAAGLDSDPRAWLSIQANLGHVYRRLEKHERSLSYFEEILRISPKDANIHSAMGLVNLQAGRPFIAIENFHEALSIQPNDQVASELLQRALEEQSRVGLDQLADFEQDEVELEELIKGVDDPLKVLKTRKPNINNNNNNVQMYEDEEEEEDSMMEIESD